MSDEAATRSAAQVFFERAAVADIKRRPRFMVKRGRWRPVTWEDAALTVERLAAFLIQCGVGDGGRVALMAETRLEWGLCGLAVSAARATLVPVYPSLVGDHLAHVLSHSGSRVLIVERGEQLERVLDVWHRIEVDTLLVLDPTTLRLPIGSAGDGRVDRCRTVGYRQAIDSGRRALANDVMLVRRQLATTRADEVSCLIYTSGTTGLPKGVPLTHANVGVNARDWLACNGQLINWGEVDLLWLPMSHIFGWGEFCLGNQLGLVSYFSGPRDLLADLPTVRPHVLMSVPVYWEKLARMAEASARPEQALRSLTGGRLKFCLSGGAGLPRSVKELFLRADMLIIEGYGLTECSPTLTLNRLDAFDFDTVGRPVPSVQLKLAADGEILAKGPSVFGGYYRDSHATEAAFDAEGWFCTGDLGRFTGEGFLQIIGRKKEILVTAGGKNIPPQNIELRFKDDPLISQLVVFGDGKKYLAALVDIDEQEARARLGQGSAVGETLRQDPRLRQLVAERVDRVNRTLARFETIKDFHIAEVPLTVAAGLLTPSLKVRRRQVYQRFRQAIDALW